MLFLSRHLWWLATLIPILIYGLALVLFQHGTNGAPDVAVLLLREIDGTVVDKQGLLRVVPAQLTWLLLAFFYFVVQLSVIGWCVWQLWRRMREGDRLPLAAASGLALILMIEVVVSGLSDSAVARQVYRHTIDALIASEVYSVTFVSFVKTFLLFINLLSPIGIAFICVTAMSQLRRLDELDEERMVTRLQFLRSVLTAGSLYLVAGVLHMGAWLRWPSMLLSDESWRAAFASAALGTTSYWALVFSVVGAFLFLLPIHLLSETLRRRAAETRTPEDCQKWLKANLVKLDPVQHFQRLAMVLAPIAAVPAGNWLQGL